MNGIRYISVLSSKTLANAAAKNTINTYIQQRICRIVLLQQTRNQSAPSDQSIKVYNGPISSQIRAVKVFSLTSSVGGIIAQPILLKQASQLGGMPVVVAVFGVVGFFTFVTPVLLHLITRKYVTEINYDPKANKYIATTINFFLRKKHTVFTPEDVKVPDIGGMFTTFKVKNIPFFVDSNAFDEPSHYAKIMGYDKPIDFKLGNDDEKDVSNKH